MELGDHGSKLCIGMKSHKTMAPSYVQGLGARRYNLRM